MSLVHMQAVHGWLSAYERLVNSQNFFRPYSTQEDISFVGTITSSFGFYFDWNDVEGKLENRVEMSAYKEYLAYTATAEYDYDVDAVSGTVCGTSIEYFAENETVRPGQQPANPETVASAQGISREKARSIALSDASLSAADVTFSEAICAKVVIDTTGDADVAALSGCEVEKRHQTTSVGMPFSMQHVDMKRLVAYLEDKQLITQLASGGKLSEGNQAIRLGFDLKKVPEFTQFMEENGIWGPLGYSLHEGEFTYINGTCIKNVDATDAQVLSDAEIKLRLQVKQLSDMLIRYIPGFEHAYLSWTPEKVGVRLTRIVKCEHVLTLDEIVSGTRFPDEVFLYGFHDCAPRITIRDGKWYGFPYRALVPVGVEGLLVAGRCVTREWEAHMSTRNTVSCMAQGQAVGTAAALCVREGVLPRKLDVQLLRRTLREQGVFLD